MEQQKKFYKRKKLYVLPQFQNQFMMVVAFQAVMIMGGLILPQHRILTSYIEKMETRHADVTVPVTGEVATSTITAQAQQADFLQEQIQEVKLLRNSITIYSCIFILITCALFGLYVSHRLGGPIFKTLRYLREYREGQKLPALKFRKGDFFHDLAEEITKALQSKEK